MVQRTRNALRRPIEMLFSAVLVLVLLTACADDDGGDEMATEAVETVQADEDATGDTGTDLPGTPEVTGEAVASPAAEPIAVSDGTPVGLAGAGSPTPEIVVAVPSRDAAAESATAEDLAGAATPVSVGADGVPVTGDGTGGAVAAGADAEPGEAPSTVGATVDSCAVESYPPFTGDVASRVTTIDVNFRSGPGTDCDAIGEPLAAGTAVEVLSDPVVREGETEFEWVAVTIDGTEGWLATEFLEPAE